MSADGMTPIIVTELDCAVTAKGDVNVSWKVRVEATPEQLTGELQYKGFNDLRAELTANLIREAAAAKRGYLAALLSGEFREVDEPVKITRDRAGIPF